MILTILAILCMVEFGLSECFPSHKLMQNQVSCSCGGTVSVDPCSYGTELCEHAATFVNCGNCQVGNSQLCQEWTPTNDLARLEAWVRSHPASHRNPAPVLAASR
jgi:hypothetical protein